MQCFFVSIILLVILFLLLLVHTRHCASSWGHFFPPYLPTLLDLSFQPFTFSSSWFSFSIAWIYFQLHFTFNGQLKVYRHTLYGFLLPCRTLKHSLSCISIRADRSAWISSSHIQLKAFMRRSSFFLSFRFNFYSTVPIRGTGFYSSLLWRRFASQLILEQLPIFPSSVNDLVVSPPRCVCVWVCI